MVRVSVPKTSNETWHCTNYYHLGMKAVKQCSNAKSFGNAKATLELAGGKVANKINAVLPGTCIRFNFTDAQTTFLILP